MCVCMYESVSSFWRLALSAGCQRPRFHGRVVKFGPHQSERLLKRSGERDEDDADGNGMWDGEEPGKSVASMSC